MRLVFPLSLLGFLLITGAQCGGNGAVVCKDSDDRVVPCEDDAGPIQIRYDAGPRSDAGLLSDAGPERPYESACNPDTETMCRLFECLPTPTGWQDGASAGYCTKPCANHAECGDINLYRCKEAAGTGSLRCHRDRDSQDPELAWSGSSAGLGSISRATTLEVLATDDRSIGALTVTVNDVNVTVESGPLEENPPFVHQRFTFSVPADGTEQRVTAEVADGIGNSSEQLARSLAVDTQAPQVSINRQPDQGLRPGGSIPGILGVSATASDNVAVMRVTYYLGEHAVGSSVEGPDWGVFMDACDVVGGGRSFELRAVAEDAAGNTGQDSFDLNVTNSGCSG